MALPRYKKFDQVRVFDTTGLGGQSGPSPIDSSKDYRVTDQAEFPLQDEGLSPSVITPRGITFYSKKYRFNQVSQLNTTESPSTNRDFLDETRALPDLK